VHPRLDDGTAALDAARYGVLDAVLDQRLQDQARHERGAGLGVGQHLHTQPLAEAQLLDGQVARQGVELVAEGHAQHRVGVERVAQEARQPRHHAVGGGVLAIEDQRGDGVERVEQEVRVQLVAQHLQLRLVGHRRRLQRGLALQGDFAAELDAEVQSAPGQQHVQGGAEIADVTEQVARATVVAEAEHRLGVEHAIHPGRQNQQARHAAPAPPRRPVPDDAEGIAQHRRQGKTEHRCGGQYVGIAPGLAVADGGQQAQGEVAEPAQGLQHPEAAAGAGQEAGQHRACSSGKAPF